MAVTLQGYVGPVSVIGMWKYDRCVLIQIGSEVEKMKANITELTAAVEGAKQKQKDAKDEIQKLEKDMDEFKNNKEGKIEQLKVSCRTGVTGTLELVCQQRH